MDTTETARTWSRIYAVLPQRPAVVRELVEELFDVSTRDAREMLRSQMDRGMLGLDWDGKLCFPTTRRTDGHS
jgi:hypothetical protein